MKSIRVVLFACVILASVAAGSVIARPAPVVAGEARLMTCADLNSPVFDGPGWGDSAYLELVPGDTITISAAPLELFKPIDKTFASVYARIGIPQILLKIDGGTVASANFPSPGIVTYTETVGFSGLWTEWMLSNEGYADWDVSCNAGIAAGCDMYVPLTADAVVGAFVVDANTFWAPGQLTAPLVTIDAGNTAWVLGVDATGKYYKIVWVCQTLWVPVGTMGPNFDKVWNGAPLPTIVVK